MPVYQSYDVADPRGVYATQTVVARDEKHAKELALPLMYGCAIYQVDKQHVAEMFAMLQATPRVPQS